MESTAARERHSLATALSQVSPDAPTLCEGWAARDLALHIVTRDRRPDALLSTQLPLLSGLGRRRLAPLEALSYDELVDRVAEGPGRGSPSSRRVVNDLMNSAEFYIHTEDVLRAQPAYSPQQKRPISEALRRKLWNQSTKTFFALAARKQRHRLTYRAPGFGPVTLGRRADPPAHIEGDVEDLVLWASGREGAAEVQLTAD
ncbi:TIGR03085 family metal-binding protein [Nesterenkonia rhizosphaerae]|uniref:TIGR03085 family metal-binding protein n=1 Tax=Nesterenkonia rhizosphaerae TaxID=1348272 RepID=A0ABP9FTX1_9MICC